MPRIEMAENIAKAEQQSLEAANIERYLANVKKHNDNKIRAIAQAVLGSDAPDRNLPVEEYGAISLATMHMGAKTPEDKKLVEQLRKEKIGEFAFTPESLGYRKIIKMANDVDEEIKIREFAKKGLLKGEDNFNLRKIIAKCPGEMLESIQKIGAIVLEEQAKKEAKIAKAKETYLGSAKLFAKNCFSSFASILSSSKYRNTDKNLQKLAEEFKAISSSQIELVEISAASTPRTSRSNSLESISSTSSRSSSSRKSDSGKGRF
jgi:hypothetical protein